MNWTRARGLLCKRRRGYFLAIVTLDMGLFCKEVLVCEEVLERFSRRWNMERLFFNLNSNGFEIKRLV